MRAILYRLFMLVVCCCLAVEAQAVPAVQTMQGPGGMPVYLVESHANPMVELRLVLPGGSVHDPAGKAGLAALTAWMFNEGGGSMDAATFQERLAFHGISMDATASLEKTTVKVTTLSQHLEEAWSCLADALLRPRLEEKDFVRAVAEQRAVILKEREQPQTQANLLLNKMLYPDHPYGVPVIGTLESLPRISLADLRRFQQESVHAPDMVLAVAGDITLSRLQELLERHLAGLDTTPAPRQPIPEVVLDQPATPPTVQHLEMDIPQTTLLLGAIGITRQDPDYYTFYVLNQLLGGSGLHSRLSMEMREKRGLTYGVYSHFSPLSKGGPFIISMKTKTASAKESLDLLHKELQRMVQDGVTEAELQEVIRYLTGSFPLHLDGLGKLATLWGNIGFHRLGLDYLDKWPERIRAVSREEVARVAARLLGSSRFYTVTVGKTL
ncbi:MAG: insulinase family protein [Magnetococcales bacterium]|nr:insulinase family protein [Magnetococcales bacterium]